MNKLTDLNRAAAKAHLAGMINWYTAHPIWAKWPTTAGSRPTLGMLLAVTLLGKRPGVEALHLAMTLRPEGCTVDQFVEVGCEYKSDGKCGPANNQRRKWFVGTGLATVTVQGSPWAFTCTLTPKAWGIINSKLGAAPAVTAKAAAKPAATAKAAKPAKVPRARKPVQAPAPMPPAPPTSQGDGSTPQTA